MKYIINKSDDSKTTDEVCSEFDTREEAEEFMQKTYLEYLDIITKNKELFIEEDYYNIESQDSHNHSKITITNRNSDYSLFNAKDWSMVAWYEFVKNIPLQIHSKHIVYEILTKKE